MKKISQILDKLEEIILVVCLSLMTLITFANVVSRKVLHFPWAFAEELTVILFIFSSLVGAAVAAKRGSLIGLTLLYDICHKNLRKIFFVLLLLASVFFVGIVTIYGIGMVRSEMVSGIKTPALGAPEWVFGLSIPVGCIILGIRLAEYSILMLRKKGDEE